MKTFEINKFVEIILCLFLFNMSLIMKIIRKFVYDTKKYPSTN